MLNHIIVICMLRIAIITHLEAQSVQTHFPPKQLYRMSANIETSAGVELPLNSTRRVHKRIARHATNVSSKRKFRAFQVTAAASKFQPPPTPK